MSVADRARTPAAAEAILDALDPEQREVAEASLGPLCVLAGAGTGKTRAITHRIAYGVRIGVYNPTSVLAVTFTARAAGEMRGRLRDLGAHGVQARTFHSAALRQLQFFWPNVVGGGLPRILEYKAPAVAEAASRLHLDVDRVAIRDLASEVEWAKVSLVSPDDYAAAAAREGRELAAGFDYSAIARVLSVYEDVKNDRGVIDFEDVLLLTVGILEERPEVAETVRGQYRHFVVDEYQDVSPVQQRLLELWLGDRKELCVVGDASQTIYSFTGATPLHLLNFSRRYNNAKVVRLVRDYRSTPQVVALANTVLDRGRGPQSKARLELVAQRKPGPPVGMSVYDDDAVEAASVVSRIRRLIELGVPASEIAVLFRTNAQSEAFEQALADAGIGYLVRGGEKFFSRKEVRDAIVLLRGAARSDDRVLAMPNAVRDILGSAGWTPQPPASRGATRERYESLQALVALADELAERNPEAGLSDLLAEIQERVEAQHAPVVDGVTLATFHAAKGLEWDAVFLVGLSEGLLPISMAEGEAAIEEERRLLYVGVTRAREHLDLSYARSRTPGGRATRRPSRFLEGLWPDGSSRTSSRLPRMAVSSGQVDEELLAKLRSWREDRADELRMPNYAILHDASLSAIAEHQPADIPSLARIRGVGAAKLERFGAEILELVARHSAG